MTHSDTAARILAIHAENGAPIEDFLDSRKPGDLDDLARELDATPAEVEAARVELSRCTDAAAPREEISVDAENLRGVLRDARAALDGDHAGAIRDALFNVIDVLGTSV